jgi:hypothetical protein
MLSTPQAPVVLLASRDTEFKKAVVQRVVEGMSNRGVSMKTVGITDLEDINAHDYDAIVIVNTCIAWGLDIDVRRFLESHNEHGNMIVVTTSGKGTWLPEKKERDYDAVSTASELTSADAVARDVIARIQKKLGPR